MITAINICFNGLEVVGGGGGISDAHCCLTLTKQIIAYR